MAFVELKISSLDELDDGRVAKAFQRELRRVVQDCLDRPSDSKPRSVTLVMKIVPIVVSNGGTVECDGVKSQFEVKSGLPPLRSKNYELTAKRGGTVLFSGNNPEDRDQTHIDDIDPVTGKVVR